MGWEATYGSICESLSAAAWVDADGTVCSGDDLLLELEDVAQSYKRPSIIDIKVPPPPPPPLSTTTTTGDFATDLHRSGIAF